MCLYFCNENLFIDAIEKNSFDCDYFVVMPHFKTENKSYISYTPKVIKTLDLINKNKLIIIDNHHEEIPDVSAAISQDYKQNILYALGKALYKLQNYNKLILVFPTKKQYPFPIPILEGFLIFCKQYDFDFEVIEEIKTDIQFETKSVFITIDDASFVTLIQQIKDRNMIMGSDVGIISYNDSPLKAILGITVFSTDFKKMGETAAEFILKNKKEIVKNPFYYIERSSI
nr:substrate-binding domain-containing protein [uncultured Flavobacterium sp.]